MENLFKFLEDFHKIKGRLPLTDGHIVLILHYIAKREHAGRYYLMEKTGIKEATLRGSLSRLREMGILNAYRGGHMLTEKGMKLLGEISKYIKILDMESPIKIDKYNTIFIVRRMENLGNILRWRDMVIKYGGTGLVILSYRDGKILFPESDEEVTKYYPDFPDRLRENVRLYENDTILIVGGETYINTLVSGLNTIIEMLRK
jgi:predicted transcriptional regulator